MSNKTVGVFIHEGHVTIVKEKTVVIVDERGNAIEVPNIKRWLEGEDDE